MPDDGQWWLRPVDQKEQQKPNPLKVLWGPDAARPQPMGTIVKGLLHSSSLTLVYGAPKSGKSFLTTSMYLAISSNKTEWMGHRIVRPGPVIYFACEGHAGYWKRLAAQGDVPEHFGLCACRPMLIELQGRTNVALPHPHDIIATLEDLIESGASLPVAIAIDTVFRSFGGGNVNQSDHMNAYIAAVTAIMDMGIAVTLVHHETKSGGSPAGSVTLIGAADTIIATKNGLGNVHTWEVEMAKDDAQTDPRSFTLNITKVGVDEHGDEVTSCVMVDQGEIEPGGTPKKRGRPKDPTLRDTVMELLGDAIVSHGVSRPIDPLIPEEVARVVHLHRWRELYYWRLHPDAKDETKRKAFDRMRTELTVAKRIGVSGMWVWIVPDGTKF